MRRLLWIVLMLMMPAVLFLACSSTPNASPSAAADSSVPRNTDSSVLDVSESVESVVSVPTQSISSETETSKLPIKKKIIEVNSDWRYYESLDDLVSKSAVIVCGKLTNKKTEIEETEIPQGESVFVMRRGITDYTLSVEKYYLGDKGDTLVFHQIGGETDTEIWLCEDVPDLEIGETYLLFLNSSDWMMAPYVAVYHAVDGELNGFFEESWKITTEDIEAAVAAR